MGKSSSFDLRVRIVEEIERVIHAVRQRAVLG
jgi:hypothetical protein